METVKVDEYMQLGFEEFNKRMDENMMLFNIEVTYFVQLGFPSYLRTVHRINQIGKKRYV